jgi:two-component system response regulator VicR
MIGKILLADDDRDLVDILRYTFQRDGYSVLLAFDGEMALRMLQSESLDLVVLDLMMPKRNGMEVLREMRLSSNVPVIVLTALGDEDHVVDALQLGADDYLLKPFRPRELRARAAALLRRSRSQPKPRDKSLQPIELGNVMLNPNTRQVTVAGQPVQLSRTEFSLLHYLMVNRNIALALSDIMANVWGYDANENDEVVKVTVSRLRRKMEADPAHPRYIVNVPGVGYMFQCDTHVAS